MYRNRCLEALIARPAAAAVCMALSMATTGTASAWEAHGGVNATGVLLGYGPRPAVSPHLGLSYHTERGFLLSVYNVVTIIPALDVHGVGLYDQLSVAVGYAWKRGRFSVGAGAAIYSMVACGPDNCGRLRGVSPGARARIDVYLLGPFGLSMAATADWLTGSVVLPSGIVASLAVGPVLKLGD